MSNIPEFKAWEKHLKQMIPVHNIDFQAQQINTNDAWRMFHEVELLQYVGVNDKNGTKLFEKDVVFSRGRGYFPVTLLPSWDSMSPSDIHGNEEEFELVGNLLENPTLLQNNPG